MLPSSEPLTGADSEISMNTVADGKPLVFKFYPGGPGPIVSTMLLYAMVSDLQIFQTLNITVRYPTSKLSQSKAIHSSFTPLTHSRSCRGFRSSLDHAGDVGLDFVVAGGVNEEVISDSEKEVLQIQEDSVMELDDDDDPLASQSIVSYSHVCLTILASGTCQLTTAQPHIQRMPSTAAGPSALGAQDESVTEPESDDDNQVVRNFCWQ
jgi:hypothetical protein